MTVTFDAFGTLFCVDRPADPAAAVADELAARDVAVPDDWTSAYRETHVEVPDGAELPLPAHVAAALRSRGVDPTDGDGSGNAVRRATVAAFDPTDVETRSDAVAAVTAAADAGPVGILSNCSVPGIVRRALRRSALDAAAFDAIVTSVACGWRKPDRRAFAAAAARLDGPVADLVHVGDDPRTDGGVADAGGTFVHVSETPLADVPAALAASR